MSDLNGLQVTTFNGVKVYHCTAGKSEAEWREEYRGHEKDLRKVDAFQNRMSIIRDFDFPGCANCAKISPDGNYIVAAGTYKPRIKIYECNNMSLKVERYCDEEVTQFQFLSDDYSKLACARADRNVEFHTQQGLHTTVRCPRFIRDMAYHRPTCDLLLATNSQEVYRLNLEHGSFQNSIVTGFSEANDGVVSMGINPQFPILGLGGRGGLESWDLRDRSSAGFLDIVESLKSSRHIFSYNSDSTSVTINSSINSILNSLNSSTSPLEVTTIRYNDETGMEVSLGLSTGHIITYDLRSSRPMYIYDHRYDAPIHSIKYHVPSRTLITADKFSTRLWDYTGSLQHNRHITTINSPAPLNDISVVPNSGMLLMACDSPQMHIFFVPRLGTVPDWAGALESLTEEIDMGQQQQLQQQQRLLAMGADPSAVDSLTAGFQDDSMEGHSSDGSNIFENQVLVSREQLESASLLHILASSSQIKPYMHGYLFPRSLYNQVKEALQLANRKANLGASMASEASFINDEISKRRGMHRDSGFSLTQQTVQQIKQDLEEDLFLAQPAAAARPVKKSKPSIVDDNKSQLPSMSASILADERLASILDDEDFRVDTNSSEFKRSTPVSHRGNQILLDELAKSQNKRKVINVQQTLSANPNRPDIP